MCVRRQFVCFLPVCWDRDVSTHQVGQCDAVLPSAGQPTAPGHTRTYEWFLLHRQFIDAFDDFSGGAGFAWSVQSCACKSVPLREL